MSETNYEETEKVLVQNEGYQPKINDVAQKFLNDLDEERKRLSSDFPLCALLIDEAFDRIYSTGRIPGKEFYADVFKQKPMKITQKVFVPIKQYPKFNFTGKILGPKGNSLRRLQEETQCKIVIKGRNSMRDRTKEEELRSSGDPKYSHLNKDLFMEISTVATPAECYARIAYALAEVRKYLIPDKNDEVSHEQLRELMEMDPELAKNAYSGGGGPEMFKKQQQFSLFRSVFDKAGIKGTPKYLNLLKETMYQGRVEQEEYGGPPPPKHMDMVSDYEYAKAQTVLTAAKRPSIMTYSTEPKRIREVPAKPNYVPKHNPYGILKKYK